MEMSPNLLIHDDSAQRRAVANDLWPYRTLGVAHQEQVPLPAIVVQPVDEDQVSAVLRVANARGIPVLPLGAGSGVVGGAASWGGEIVIDMKRYQHLIEIDTEGMSVRVSPGVLGQRLEDALLAQGYTLGHYPSSIACSTVGGWLAARSAGQQSSRYGKIDDMVLSMRIVTPAQGVLDTDEEPGLMQIVLGSEGTLGVITEARLRIHRAPQELLLRGFRFATLRDALDGARVAMTSGVQPSVLRIYDPLDTRIALGEEGSKPSEEPGLADEIVRDLRRLLLGDDPLAAAVRLALVKPKALGAARKFAGKQCLVVVGFDGSEDDVEERMTWLRNIWSEQGATDLGTQPGETWLRKRHSVSFKAPRMFRAGLFADTMELACGWSQMELLYDQMMEILSSFGVPMAHFSHAYPEGVSVYVSFVGPGKDLEHGRTIYREMWGSALAKAQELGATCTHHHGVGVLKRAEATLEAGPALRGWSVVKDWLDPANILNPGVLFEGWAGDPRSFS